MRLAIRILAALLIFLGVIWILQGINILPGSYMSGHVQWAWRGAIVVLLGAALMFVQRRLFR
jgi:hypothetical protein